MADEKKKADRPYPLVRGCIVTVSKENWEAIHAKQIRPFDCTIVGHEDIFETDRVKVKLSSDEFPEKPLGKGYQYATLDKDGHVVIAKKTYKARLAKPPQDPNFPRSKQSYINIPETV